MHKIETQNIFGLNSQFGKSTATRSTTRRMPFAQDETGAAVASESLEDMIRYSQSAQYCGSDLRDDLGALVTEFGQVALAPAELITNGDFSNGTDDWTFSSGITLPAITAADWWTGSQLTISGAGEGNGVYTFAVIARDKPEFRTATHAVAIQVGGKWGVFKFSTSSWIYQSVAVQEWPWSGAWEVVSPFDYTGTSVTVSGAPDSDYNGEYQYFDTFSGKPIFERVLTMETLFIRYDHDNSKWIMFTDAEAMPNGYAHSATNNHPWNGSWVDAVTQSPVSISVTSLADAAPAPATPSANLGKTGTTFWDGLTVTVEGAGSTSANAVYTFSGWNEAYPRFTSAIDQQVRKLGGANAGKWALGADRYIATTVTSWPWEATFEPVGTGVAPAPIVKGWGAFYTENNEAHIYIPRGTPGNESPLILQEITPAVAGQKYKVTFEARFQRSGELFSSRIDNWNGSSWDWGGSTQLIPTTSTDWTAYEMEIIAAYSTKLRFIFAPDYPSEDGGDAYIRNISVKPDGAGLYDVVPTSIAIDYSAGVYPSLTIEGHNHETLPHTNLENHIDISALIPESGFGVPDFGLSLGDFASPYTANLSVEIQHADVNDSDGTHIHGENTLQVSGTLSMQLTGTPASTSADDIEADIKAYFTGEGLTVDHLTVTSVDENSENTTFRSFAFVAEFHL